MSSGNSSIDEVAQMLAANSSDESMPSDTRARMVRALNALWQSCSRGRPPIASDAADILEALAMIKAGRFADARSPVRAACGAIWRARPTIRTKKRTFIDRLQKKIAQHENSCAENVFRANETAQRAEMICAEDLD